MYCTPVMSLSFPKMMSQLVLFEEKCYGGPLCDVLYQGTHMNFGKLSVMAHLADLIIV